MPKLLLGRAGQAGAADWGASVGRWSYPWLIGSSTLDALASPATPTQQENTLARAKNTSRSEARRRTRAALRAEGAELEASEELDEATEPVTTPERPRMFRMPNVREDIRALPSIFRSRRLLWVPPLLLVGGFVLTLALPALPDTIASIAELYVQFFFVPPALFTFFIAGFLAPRASWLVGLLVGVGAGVLWFIALVPASAVPDAQSFASVLFSIVLNGVLYGTLAAAFAAWYRDFLRSMQSRGRDRRAEQEAKERAKRRAERQEARSVFKRSN